MKKTNQNNQVIQIAYLAFILALISFIWQWKTHVELKQLYCDLKNSILVERRFIQSSINKTSDENIDFSEKIFYPNGKEVTNPIATNSKYKCN